MKKDIEWLKDEILTDMWYLEGNREIQQLDIKYQTLREVVQKINSLDEPKKVVVPEIVAEYIQEGHELGVDLGTAMTIETELLKHIRDYIKNNEETFARAWLDGFTIANEDEEEQKYYVLVRDEEYGGFWFLYKKNNGNISIGINRNYSEIDWVALKLTEQEMKDYDERFWAFAVLKGECQ